MQNVNDPIDSSSTPYAEPPGTTDEAEIVGWVRWWHWLIAIALGIAAFVYYPLWRFEQNWKQLQIGDSLDRMQQLLGDPGKPSYSVQGTGPSGGTRAYVYRKYWRSYEVLVSMGTQQVTAKNPGEPASVGPRNQQLLGR